LHDSYVFSLQQCGGCIIITWLGWLWKNAFVYTAIFGPVTAGPLGYLGLTNEYGKGGKHMVQYEKVDICPVCLENTSIHDFIPQHNIKECTNCGYVFDSPRPTLQTIAELYSQDEKYDQWLQPAKYRYLIKTNHKRLRIISKYSQRRNLFDVGGGCGFLLSLAKKEGYYDDVLGTEISTSAIKIAHDTFGIQLIQGEIEKVSLPRLFDNISIFHVLEHVPNCRTTLLAIHKLLNPGGIIFVAVPNDVDRILNLRRKIQRKPILPKIVLKINKQIHLSHFRVHTMKYLLESCGYEIVFSGLDPVGVSDRGARGLLWKIYYFISKIVLTVFKNNIFWTMLIIAKKK
jgi:2-polyprenyl-3-methyl-5-hydroxy-6-metoxy-1,4-benzoquinol methylase